MVASNTSVENVGRGHVPWTLNACLLCTGGQHGACVPVTLVEVHGDGGGGDVGTDCNLCDHELVHDALGPPDFSYQEAMGTVGGGNHSDLCLCSF